MKATILKLLLLVPLLATLSARAEEGAADARRHMLRGIAAIEMAKNSGELVLAADEFRRATELDPALSAAWYNLGSVQAKMGKFDAAIASYKRYLVLEPKADDAQKIQDELVKLEFRQEQVNKSTIRAGTWIAANFLPYQVKVDGNVITMETKGGRYDYSRAEDYSGSKTYTGKESFRLQANGGQLSGTWMHRAFTVDKCTVPEESGDVAGNVIDPEKIFVLRYVKTNFRADTAGILEYSCNGVEPVVKREIKMGFYGPLPHGGLGVEVYTSTFSYDMEGLAAIGHGRLIATPVPDNSAAYASGLRKDDEILAIDGVEIKSLPILIAMSRLRGEPGSMITLSVMHKGAKEPVSLQLKRVAVPDYEPGSGKPLFY